MQFDAHTNWGGTTMPLQERAVSIAELLRDSPELRGKDIAIVAHSFGGIVAKQMVRHIHGRDRFHDLGERLAGVVFVATPHSGADIANYGRFLRWAIGSTVTLEDLRHHAPLLVELSDWYRNSSTPPAHVLYETRSMKLGWFRRWLMIVDRASANPGFRHTQHGSSERIGDLILDHLRRLPGIFCIDDNLDVGQIRNRVDRRLPYRIKASSHDKKCSK